MRRFAPGEGVVWRSVHRDDRIVSFVWPWTVVRDEGSEIVLYLPPGTIGKQRTGVRGGPRDRLLLTWDGAHRDVVWRDTNVVRLYREGEDFSIWIARDHATGALLWRYINLEAPWLRTPIGFDSRDHILDLYSEAGEDAWHWKDEDEVAWLIDQGRMDAAFAAKVRESGERALEKIRSGDSLLDDAWSGWRPDPAWAAPRLPAQWREYEPASS